MNSFTHKKRRFLMETEYLGNAYTTQSSNDGCVAVACPIDAGCAINACALLPVVPMPVQQIFV